MAITYNEVVEVYYINSTEHYAYLWSIDISSLECTRNECSGNEQENGQHGPAITTNIQLSPALTLHTCPATHGKFCMI